MEIEGYRFLAQAEIVMDGRYAVIPISFILTINPDEDEELAPMAGRAIMEFMKQTHEGRGGYDS